MCIHVYMYIDRFLHMGFPFLLGIKNIEKTLENSELYTPIFPSFKIDIYQHFKYIF